MFLKDIKNNLKKSDTWKTELTITINFIFSKDTDEKRVMHSQSDNIEIMTWIKNKKATIHPVHGDDTFNSCNSHIKP